MKTITEGWEENSKGNGSGSLTRVQSECMIAVSLGLAKQYQILPDVNSQTIL